MDGRLLNAEVRTERGKNSCYRLRVQGYIPAVVYSHGKSDAIKVKEKDFLTLFKGHISESVLFTLKVDGLAEKEMTAYVKDYQRDPVSGRVLHLDFYRITKGEKIKTHVPIELVGEPKGVKLGGILEHGERELFIHCAANLLPERIEVDITNLGLGDAIHVSDLKLNPEIEILTSGHSLIAVVERPRTAEETTETTESGSESQE